jgi:guanylate kinase
MAGKLIVISGPSGVGKTTICEWILTRPGFRRVITATSRPPRSGERDGVDYHFLPREAFEAAIRRGEFLESALVHGHLYGTPRSAVEAGLREAKWLLLNIDVQGARQIREAVRSGAPLPACFIFIEPPSLEELARRLAGRGTDAPAVVKSRLETALLEMKEREHYDSAVVNDEVEAAGKRILEAVGYPEASGSR